MAIELRDYQQRAVDDVRAALAAGKRRVVLQLATGGGKSIIACHIAHGASVKQKRICFVVDRLELVDQMSEHLDNIGLRHGVLQGRHERTAEWLPIQVATVQTLARRKVDPFDLYVYDECHSFHKYHQTIMDRNPEAFFLGLSATPFTEGLGKYFEQLILGPTTRALIDGGHLVPFEVWAPSAPDLSNVPVVAGEWKTDELSAAMNKPDLVGDIVATWLEKAAGRPTLLFAVDRAHSDHLAKQFGEAGVTAVHLDCFTPNDERKQIIERFKRGDIQVLCNVGILTKGFDAPIASCLIYARPVRSSLALYIQMGGRVLRTAPGKTNAIILDHAGNTERHGFLDDPLPQHLDDGKKKFAKAKRAASKLPKACPACKFMKPAGVHTCPNCGFAPARPNERFSEAGDLVKVVDVKMDRADLWAQLEGWRQYNNKSPGRAAHVYKDIVGTWPPRGPVEPKDPSPQLMAKIRHLNIRYAKRMQRERGRV